MIFKGIKMNHEMNLQQLEEVVALDLKVRELMQALTGPDGFQVTGAGSRLDGTCVVKQDTPPLRAFQDRLMDFLRHEDAQLSQELNVAPHGSFASPLYTGQQLKEMLGENYH